MEKSFIGQEDQMSKLRTEVGANLNSLNYDISGLLQFKNESGKSTTVRWLWGQRIQGHLGVEKAENPLMDKIVKKPTQILRVVQTQAIFFVFSQAIPDTRYNGFKFE